MGCTVNICHRMIAAADTITKTANAATAKVITRMANAATAKVTRTADAATEKATRTANAGTTIIKNRQFDENGCRHIELEHKGLSRTISSIPFEFHQRCRCAGHCG